MTAVLLATKTRQARAHACLVTLCRLHASAASRLEDGCELDRQSPSSSFASGTAFTVNLQYQSGIAAYQGRSMVAFVYFSSKWPLLDLPEIRYGVSQ